jgi:hypothetical protein
VRLPASLGSKFAGSEFENEQMGHIQVAIVLGTGEAALEPGLSWRMGDGAPTRGFRPRPGGALVAAGNRITFGDDFNQPAYEDQ